MRERVCRVNPWHLGWQPWRTVPVTLRAARICNPLPNFSANGPATDICHDEPAARNRLPAVRSQSSVAGKLKIANSRHLTTAN